VKVAYVVSLFPKISETFILREMQALQERGIEIVVVSLKGRREPIAHAGAESFLERTVYVDDAGRALASFLRRAWRQPLAAMRLLGRVIAAHATRPLQLAKAISLVAVSARVADEVRERRADRVHAHWATWPALVAWAVGRLEGIPYSITAHAHDIFLPNPMLRRKIEESEFAVTISDFNRRFLAERCGATAAGRIRVIHCGLPLEAYPRRRPAAAEGGPLLVSVGRLVDYKGFPVLLRAVALVRARSREVVCEIVGEGPLEGRLREEVGRLGLEDVVRLRGARTQDEVRDLLRAAAVCVLASERGRDGQMDGIPVVLMEAMALGAPVVSTRISGIPEIVEDGVTGLLAEPGSPESLAAAIERILGDANLAARLADAARLRIEEGFDIRRVASDLHALLVGGDGGSI